MSLVLTTESDCQRVDWRDHKYTCLALSGGQWCNVKFSTTPPGMQGLHMSSVNKFDDIGKLGNSTRTSASDPPSENKHGDKLFLVKLQMGPWFLVYDRSRSFQGYIGADGQSAAYNQVKNEMRGPGGAKFGGMKMYRWAKRVGDWELSLCLNREPQQNIAW